MKNLTAKEPMLCSCYLYELMKWCSMNYWTRLTGLYSSYLDLTLFVVFGVEFVVVGLIVLVVVLLI